MNRILPKFLTESQMVALATAPDPVTRKGKRDRAILGLLSSSGLRASELCGLRVGDVTHELVFVRRAKFGAQRFVPVSLGARAAMTRYLAIHPAKPGDRLFRTLAGRPLTRRNLHKIVTHHERRAGLKPGGVHRLRHSAATRWLNRGCSLQSVRVMLGHVHLATTGIYLSTATDSLVAEYRRTVDGGWSR